MTWWEIDGLTSGVRTNPSDGGVSRMSFVPEFQASAGPVEPSNGRRYDLLEAPSRITVGFNIAMFAFLGITGFLGFLVQSEKAGGVPLAGLVLTTGIDMTRYLVVLLVTAFFLREFWARLISALWRIRQITCHEAIAIVLMIGMLFHA